MHTIYHTRAVILKSQPAGESNGLFWLFTESIGLVRAVATGIRKHSAKLRGQLVDYTFIDVDLVRGKDVWRLISASASLDPVSTNIRKPLVRPYVRTLSTLERFLIDEGEHRELFLHVLECAQALESEIDANKFDTLAIWRTLVHLGYIAVAKEDEQLFNTPFVQALMLLDEPTTKALIRTVNDTIKQTHL